MNENLNLCEILKDCPKGTKLYSPIFGKIFFLEINNNSSFPILCTSKNGLISSFASSGKYSEYKDAECVIFPSEDQKDWSKFKVPIKRFDPKTLQPFDRILTRDFNDEEWTAALFGYIDLMEEFPCRNVGTISSYCIPYNDETKNLLGTTDDCPEYYKWWEN